MAGISQTELSARRQKLLDELPNHAWDYAKAGVEAGYSPSYARARLKKYVTKDSTFCQQIAAKRAEIEAGTQDKREKAARKLESIIDGPNSRPNEVIRAVEVLGKMSGWMSETRVLETPQRRHELSEAQQREARLCCLWRFDTRRGLPGESVDGPGQDQGGPATARNDHPPCPPEGHPAIPDY
jgi:hypothetical protein